MAHTTTYRRKGLGKAAKEMRSLAHAVRVRCRASTHAIGPTTPSSSSWCALVCGAAFALWYNAADGNIIPPHVDKCLPPPVTKCESFLVHPSNLRANNGSETTRDKDRLLFSPHA